jgi:anti-sigma regulatory factor (Ser/Thr protein kinase)
VSDAIRVTIPRTKPFYGVVRLVVGGLAARLDVSYEDLDDLQLALESLLANDAYAAGPDVTVELVVVPGAVEMRVGPLNGRRLRPELEREREEQDGVGLRRLLGTVVERVELEQRDGGEWVRLEKHVPGVGR